VAGYSAQLLTLDATGEYVKLRPTVVEPAPVLRPIGALPRVAAGLPLGQTGGALTELQPCPGRVLGEVDYGFARFGSLAAAC
jgi:hypothetical protein